MPRSVEVPSVLKGHAREIWRAAFLGSYDTTCKGRSDRDACAASIAWTAVKKDYKRNDLGQWVARSESLEARLSEINGAFSRQFSGWGSMGGAIPVPPGTPTPYVVQTFDDDNYVVVTLAGQEYRVDFSYGSSGMTFAPPAEWLPVEQRWMSEAEQGLAQPMGMGMGMGMMDQVGGSIMRGGADEAEEKSMTDEVRRTYDHRKAERENANRMDWAVIRSAEGQKTASRPDHMESNKWARLAPELRTVGAVLFERICWRTYEQAVEDAVLGEGWKASANPSRPEEMVFSRWLKHEQGPLLQRAILVRRYGQPDWYLRELSRGASLSLATRISPYEVRYRGPKIILHGVPA